MTLPAAALPIPAPVALPKGVCIGCVPYLNAQPLVSFIPGRIELEVPSQLALRYEAGALDAALLPVYQMLQHATPVITDGVCISSRGPVFSVFLAYRGPLHAIRRVHLDPSSCTSNALFRCLCAEFLDWMPEFSTQRAGPEDARILIGDPAIDFRLPHPKGWNFLDLGESWTHHTGLPFVYAVWALCGDLAPQMAEFLRVAKEIGMAHLSELAAKNHRPDFAKTYLGGHIGYDLNEPEKQGLSLFAELLYKYGLSPVLSKPRFV
jgi:chorismate dehydratase